MSVVRRGVLRAVQEQPSEERSLNARRACVARFYAPSRAECCEATATEETWFTCEVGSASKASGARHGLKEEIWNLRTQRAVRVHRRCCRKNHRRDDCAVQVEWHGRELERRAASDAQPEQLRPAARRSPTRSSHRQAAIVGRNQPKR